MLCATGALIVNVNVPPARPCTNWLVTVSPLGAVIDSKAGTPLIVTESLSSESTGDAVIPICVDPPAGTVREEGAISVGGSPSYPCRVLRGTHAPLGCCRCKFRKFVLHC
jgi:hypothetical protein